MRILSAADVNYTRLLGKGYLAPQPGKIIWESFYYFVRQNLSVCVPGNRYSSTGLLSMSLALTRGSPFAISDGNHVPAPLDFWPT